MEIWRTNIWVCMYIDNIRHDQYLSMFNIRYDQYMRIYIYNIRHDQYLKTVIRSFWSHKISLKGSGNIFLILLQKVNAIWRSILSKSVKYCIFWKVAKFDHILCTLNMNIDQISPYYIEYFGSTWIFHFFTCIVHMFIFIP